VPILNNFADNKGGYKNYWLLKPVIARIWMKHQSLIMGRILRKGLYQSCFLIWKTCHLTYWVR